MKYFNVTVMARGVRHSEMIKAENRAIAISKAKSKFSSGIVLNARETSAPIGDNYNSLVKNVKHSLKRKININDKISTIRQVAVMTDAGIAINDTLIDVSNNTTNPQLKEIYMTLSNDINAGKSLSDSMSQFREEFGHVALAMTKLGERTGNISGSYHKLADILENLRDNTAKFKKAIRYPLITLTAMAIAFTILIMVVVPKFKDIFDKFKTELPLPTKILLVIEHVMSNYGLFVLIGLALLIYGVVYSYKHNEKFQYQIDKILIHPHFYLINKVIFLSTMYKYTLVFGELIRAGIPVSEALDTAVGMVDNLAIKEKLLAVNANIGRGMSLAESLEQTGLFENMLLQMVKAGEAGGQLDAMLGKVTDYYNMRFQDIIDNLSTYIEPIMMFFIAGLVLLMALGIFMPMWDLGRAVKN